MLPTITCDCGNTARAIRDQKDNCKLLCSECGASVGLLSRKRANPYGLVTLLVCAAIFLVLCLVVSK